MAFENIMASGFGANVYQMTPPTYTNYPVSDDVLNSRQQLPVFPDSCRRMSRSHIGQRTPGSMRVVKPSSASTSPNSMMARRRTLANDNNLAQRRQQALDQAILQQMQDTSSYYMGHHNLVGRNDRPVSWHPSSHVPATAQQQQEEQMQSQLPTTDFSQYGMAVSTPYHTNEYYASYQNLPPTPTAYSGHPSPVAGFSPLLAAYVSQATQSNAMPAYVSAPMWMPPAQTASNFTDGGEFCPTYSNQETYNNWHAYSPQEMQPCTAPATPDEFQVVQQPQTIPSEESIPYQPLEESTNEDENEEEEEGEILIGMGLYDLPSKGDMDPELDYYRTTTSQLLNTTYRHGKGWKLEESWEPPATDDEDNEDDADEQDDEEDEEEEEEEK
ncbi:hypothetical protein GGS21DRAFT_497696 [Xylaria nigripes]|nr:hypothetical protein GGS21DRAFT_497696 [Xylaria nigripes]